jgi:hypothetical protein
MYRARTVAGSLLRKRSRLKRLLAGAQTFCESPRSAEEGNPRSVEEVLHSMFESAAKIGAQFGAHLDQERVL